MKEPTSPVHSDRVHTVDALRGIAALAVCWYHFTNGSAAWLPDGWVKVSGRLGEHGVDIFFVISGFVLPLSLSLCRYRLADFPRFTAKRLLRLEPPYLVMVLVCVLLGFVVSALPVFRGPPFKFDLGQVLSHLLYISPFTGHGWLNPVFWTLGIEFQFYLWLGLTFPLLLITNAFRKAAILLAPLALLAVFPSELFFWRYWGLFQIGIVAWMWQRRQAGKAFCLIMAALALTVNATQLGPVSSLAAGLTALVILSLRISWKPLLLLGAWSYSLYLVHVPFGSKVINLLSRYVHNYPLRVVATLAAIGVSIGVAAVLYHLVEKPAIRWAKAVRYRRSEKNEESPSPTTATIQAATPVTTASSKFSLANATVSGAFWTTFCSGALKVISLVAQFVLAWLLSPADWGAAAATFSVTGIASVIAGTNLHKILVQDGEGFQKRVGQVFWLSLAMNTFAAVLIAAFAPVLARAFDNGSVRNLLWLMALACPIMALPTVYSASLYRDLRFREVAMINLGAGVVQNVATITLAALGFGPYAIVAPLLLTTTGTWLAVRRLAGRVPVGAPNPKEWLPLLRSCSWIMAAALFTALQAHGVTLVLGLGESVAAAGFYFWGSSVSSQIVFLLATNLQSVFFPVLAKLNERPAEQAECYRKMVAALTSYLVPLCGAQALLAPVLLPLLFPEKWAPAIPVIRWLSAGMALHGMVIATQALLQARGRFRASAFLTGISGLATMVAAAVGARLGGPAEIALLVCLTMVGTALACGVIARRELGTHVRLFPIRSMLPGMIATAAAFVPTVLFPHLHPVALSAIVLLLGTALLIHFLRSMDATSYRWSRDLLQRALLRLRGPKSCSTI